MTTVTHRDRLASIRERTRNARQARQRARTTLEAARAAGDDQAAGIASLALDQANVEVETADALEKMVLESMSGNGNGHHFRESFLDDPNTVSTLEQLAFSSQPIGNLMLGQLMDAETFASSFGRPRAQSDDFPGLEGKRQQVWGPIIRQPYRALRLLDVLTTGTMTGSQIEYVVELGDLDEGVAETEEGAVKPEDTTTDFDEATAPARTIATWKKARRQVLADVPELSTVLTQRLIYKVNRRVEQQVLIGDGVGQNLTGLLNQTGVTVVPFDPDIPLSDLLLRGVTTVAMSDAAADAIVLHPMTAEALLTTKTTGSGERLDSSGAFDSDGDTLWGRPVVQSMVMPLDKALVGDFSVACTLLVREGVNIRLSDSDQDDFLRNRTTLLAETRVALPVWAPTALCEVELAPPGP